jgi:hypothetical protein
MTINDLFQLLHAADNTITLDAVAVSAKTLAVNHGDNVLSERTVISHASADAIATDLDVETY